MKASRWTAFWVISSSFCAAMVLTVIPLPDTLRALRPEWVALVLIYWCLAVPQRVGIGSAWVAGLLTDALTGTLLGQHALGFAVLAYVILKLHRRVRLFPLPQQIPVVLVLLTIYQLLNLWILGISGAAPSHGLAWLQPVIGALLWPIVFLALRAGRRRFKLR
ncbi:MAG: rod shape-determining protein MreD [Chromatiales bacterium]|nr:rod shape-determining protein MreD [Chromatiales bacterium]